MPEVRIIFNDDDNDFKARNKVSRSCRKFNGLLMLQITYDTNLTLRLKIDTEVHFDRLLFDLTLGTAIIRKCAIFLVR